VWPRAESAQPTSPAEAAAAADPAALNIGCSGQPRSPSPNGGDHVRAADPRPVAACVTSPAAASGLLRASKVPNAMSAQQTRTWLGCQPPSSRSRVRCDSAGRIKNRRIAAADRSSAEARKAGGCSPSPLRPRRVRVPCPHIAGSFPGSGWPVTPARGREGSAPPVPQDIEGRGEIPRWGLLRTARRRSPWGRERAPAGACVARLVWSQGRRQAPQARVAVNARLPCSTSRAV